MVKKVLFVCVENSGRSQMAEAFARLHGQDKIEASSAGTMPASEVYPSVVKVMLEKGFDLSGKKPKLLTVDMVKDADEVVVMGCGAEGFCPAPMLKKVVNWELEDPKDKPLEEVRRIRDEIERKVLKFASEVGG